MLRTAPSGTTASAPPPQPRLSTASSQTMQQQQQQQQQQHHHHHHGTTLDLHMPMANLAPLSAVAAAGQHHPLSPHLPPGHLAPQHRPATGGAPSTPPAGAGPATAHANGLLSAASSNSETPTLPARSSPFSQQSKFITFPLQTGGGSSAAHLHGVMTTPSLSPPSPVGPLLSPSAPPLAHHLDLPSPRHAHPLLAQPPPTHLAAHLQQQQQQQPSRARQQMALHALPHPLPSIPPLFATPAELSMLEPQPSPLPAAGAGGGAPPHAFHPSTADVVLHGNGHAGPYHFDALLPVPPPTLGASAAGVLDLASGRQQALAPPAGGSPGAGWDHAKPVVSSGHGLHHPPHHHGAQGSPHGGRQQHPGSQQGGGGLGSAGSVAAATPSLAAGLAVPGLFTQGLGAQAEGGAGVLHPHTHPCYYPLHGTAAAAAAAPSRRVSGGHAGEGRPLTSPAISTSQVPTNNNAGGGAPPEHPAIPPLPDLPLLPGLPAASDVPSASVDLSPAVARTLQGPAAQVVQQLLAEIPAPLQPVVMAKVATRGRGGRQPAADPRAVDPDMDPRKVRRILANRQSAARSKMKQRVLLETLRVNKEVMAARQSGVQEELARLRGLVHELQARNQRLEERLQLAMAERQHVQHAQHGQQQQAQQQQAQQQSASGHGSGSAHGGSWQQQQQQQQQAHANEEEDMQAGSPPDAPLGEAPGPLEPLQGPGGASPRSLLGPSGGASTPMARPLVGAAAEQQQQQQREEAERGGGGGGGAWWAEDHAMDGLDGQDGEEDEEDEQR